MRDPDYTLVHTPKEKTRRSILSVGLRSTATAAIAGSLAPFTFGASGSLDRAVVSIYLHGGWDSNNLLVPMNGDDYNAYASARGPLAITQNRLLPVQSSRQGASFGLHPSFAELGELYKEGALAIVANNGTLPRPMTTAEAQAPGATPPETFQHTPASYANYAYCDAAIVPWAVQIQPTDPDTDASQIFSMSGTGILAPDRVNIAGPMNENPTIRRAMAATSRLRTPFPADSMGAQLLQVARILASASRLGMRRVVISCGLGGWDMHRDQVSTEPAQFASLSRALAAFYQATQELGIADRVVTHTQTEFNRTMTPNKMGGTDHGWGGHSLVLGGSVRGGDVYGSFQPIALGGPADFNGKGVWVPTTSHEQVGATIAYWFGVGMSDLHGATPGIENFQQKNLGFLG